MRIGTDRPMFIGRADFPIAGASHSPAFPTGCQHHLCVRCSVSKTSLHIWHFILDSNLPGELVSGHFLFVLFWSGWDLARHRSAVATSVDRSSLRVGADVHPDVRSRRRRFGRDASRQSESSSGRVFPGSDCQTTTRSHHLVGGSAGLYWHHLDQLLCSIESTIQCSLDGDTSIPGSLHICSV